MFTVDKSSLWSFARVEQESNNPPLFSWMRKKAIKLIVDRSIVDDNVVYAKNAVHLVVS